jgi:hypothetical protein
MMRSSWVPREVSRGILIEAVSAEARSHLAEREPCMVFILQRGIDAQAPAMFPLLRNQRGRLWFPVRGLQSKGPECGKKQK